MPRLLILLSLPKEVTAQYRARIAQGFPELSIDVADHHSKVGPFIAAADILLTFGPTMQDHVLRDGASLKWVQALGTGLDGITDQPSLRPGVLVTNMHGIQGAPVSEAVLMLMLALSRDLPRNVRSQDERAWVRWPSRLLDGKTVGILGVGAIAEVLAPKCKAFGMTVVGITSAKRAVKGFDRMHGIDELAQVAGALDYLVLLTPYSPATHHLIDERVLAAMKPSSYLINLARGGIVDEAALIRALEQGRIAGAGLDVFKEEPLPPDHALWGFKNVIITPHLGGLCDVYVDLAMPTIEHNMRCFLGGDLAGMRNVVTQGAAAHGTK